MSNSVIDCWVDNDFINGAGGASYIKREGDLKTSGTFTKCQLIVPFKIAEISEPEFDSYISSLNLTDSQKYIAYKMKRELFKKAK